MGVPTARRAHIRTTPNYPTGVALHWRGATESGIESGTVAVDRVTPISRHYNVHASANTKWERKVCNPVGPSSRT